MDLESVDPNRVILERSEESNDCSLVRILHAHAYDFTRLLFGSYNGCNDALAGTRTVATSIS